MRLVEICSGATVGRGRKAETGGSTGKAETAGNSEQAGAVWGLGGLGAGQGTWLVLWGPGQCWGALCDFLPYIPVLYREPPLFYHHLPILAHLSSKTPFVGCQGETQVGVPNAEQSPGQTVCLGAKNPHFPPSRCHDMEVLACPQACATKRVTSPWPTASPCFPQGKTSPRGARLQPHP